MIVFKRFIIVSRKEIYAIVMLAAFALGGIFAAQPAAAQSIPNDGFAGSDIEILIPAPSGDASNPQINSNTDMNIIP